MAFCSCMATAEALPGIPYAQPTSIRSDIHALCIHLDKSKPVCYTCYTCYTRYTVIIGLATPFRPCDGFKHRFPIP